MAQTLPPVPYQVPMVDSSGRVSGVWNQFFRQVFNRAGGNIAPSNAELASDQAVAVSGVQSQVVTLAAAVASLQSQVLTLSDVSGGLTQGRAL